MLINDPTRSCSVCRRRKTRCNRQSPCSNCVRSRRKEACVYDEEPQPGRPRPRSALPGRCQNPTQSLQAPNGGVPTAFAATSTSTAPPTSRYSSTSVAGDAPASSPVAETTRLPPPDHIGLMRNRIRHLEEHLSKATQERNPTTITNPFSDIEATSSRLAGTFHVHSEIPSEIPSTIFGGSALMSRSISHKTRLLGQSHWVNCAIPIVSTIDTALRHCSSA
jgi:hypothetical protein